MYVRMKAADIDSAKLTHLYSEVIRKSYGTQPTGITEWTGVFCQSLLSIAWDWILLNDGLYSIHAGSRIRTNILLVDGRGYDVDPDATEKVCVARIAALSWQEYLQAVLHIDR